MRSSKLFCVFAISCILSLGGCRALETRFAVQYNDEIVGYQMSVARQFMNLGDSYETADSAQIYAALQMARDTVEWARKRVREMPPYDGDSSLYIAAQPLFDFYVKLVMEEYPIACQINSLPDDAITEAHIETLTALQQRIEREEIPLDKAFGEAQKEFAREYGFQIETQSLEEIQDNSGYME